PWRFIVAGHVVAEDPRHVVLRDTVFNHLAHHRGQLTVYLRLNEKPVPAIYGPSADEKQFLPLKPDRLFFDEPTGYVSATEHRRSRIWCFRNAVCKTMNGARVLIADEDPLARRALREQLGSVDWIREIHEWADGLGAMRALDALQPDLLFMDIGMPAASG